MLREFPLWRVMREEGRTSPSALLRVLDADRPPVDVAEIARRLGVEIRHPSAPGWSGAVSSEGDHAVMWINPSDAPVRQRFTMAHELGHLMLHPLGVAYRDVQFNESPYEAQANRYAANLLMPLVMVQHYVDVVGPRTSRLAMMFGVSDAAMKIRLGKLIGA